MLARLASTLVTRDPSIVGHATRVTMLATQLAQWSGECEVPLSFFVTAERPPQSTTNDNWLEAPNSIGLGWNADGRAIISIQGEPGCGQGDLAGVYLVSLDHSRTILVTGSDAQLWDSRTS